MKRIYYIFNTGTLKRKNNTIAFVPDYLESESQDENLQEEILIETNKDTKTSFKGAKFIPIKDIESVVALGEVVFNKRFLELLAANSIPLHIFNYYGNYKGSYYPPQESLSGAFLIKQVKFYTSFARRFFIASKFVEGANLNIIKNLKRYQKKSLEIENIIKKIQDTLIEIPEIKDFNRLRNIEAQVHKMYYSTFNHIINSDIKFQKRAFNPPPDPFNALISYSNALVYSLIASEIYRTKLSPFVSFLHEPGTQKISLVYDIAEIFKPLLADRVIFTALNKKIIQTKDFEYKGNACYLNTEGRKKITEIFDSKCNKTIIHRELKKSVSYRRLVRLECYKLVAHIQKKKTYKPFTIWW